jgi:5-methylthioadenosine/S-adenosylhomocysteine deaminase
LTWQPWRAQGQVPVIDTLIVGATLVTMDAERRIITDGALGIAGDRIAAIGKRAAIEPSVTARRVVDGRRFVMTPGFVNGHVHTTETLVKGYIPEDVAFDDGIWRWSVPLYELQSVAEQCLAAELSAVSMLRSGTTCFLEAGTILALDPVFEALRASGIRGRVGRWVLDRAFSGDADQTVLTDRALRLLDDDLCRHPGRGERLGVWPLLIGHNTNTDELWRGARMLADTHGVGISAHMSPMEGDAAWYLAHTGRRPVEHLDSLGVLGGLLNLTHMVHVDAHEIDLLAQTHTQVTHCPGAALKGAFGVSRLGRFPEMVAKGITVMLGTDGADHADLMRETTLTAALFKDARRNTSVFPAHQALTMATLNGAKALGLSADIGSLEVGKKADLVLHDTDRPEWRPLLNVVAQLVWSADGRGVHSVWVDGRCVVEDYRCTVIDEDRLYAEAQRAALAITARSGLPKLSPWPVV